MENFYCHVCGEDSSDNFNMVTLADRTDRPFLVHNKCILQLGGEFFFMNIKSVVKVKSEVCVCAAVLATDGKYYRGHRHSDCIRTICERPGNAVDKGMRTNQGFITSTGRFVNREEGARLQNAAGVVSVWTGKPIDGILFSEDLY